jgi:pantoate--beta-alanine ligase
LKTIKHAFNENVTLDELRKRAEDMIAADPAIELEYFAISETRTLERAEFVEAGKQYVAHVVAWIEGVRLIDNMLLND